MSFGVLSQQMKVALRPFVEGRSVIDLGAGDLGHSVELKRLGASRVLAVDQHPMSDIDGIETHCCNFSDPIEAMDVAFLSWPINRYCTGLNELLDQHDIVIYLGSNLEGNACGSLELFQHLTQRNPIVHACEPRNTLLVYSRSARVESLYAEEIAAIDSWNGGPVMTYQEATMYNQDYR